MKAFRFKIRRPSKAIIEKFETHIDLCRELYNAGLQERRDAYKLNKISISYRDQQNLLPELKELRDDLNCIHSQVLQDALKRLDNTFKAFFLRIKKGGRAGYPRFKSKSRYDSFTFPQANGSFRLEGKNLYLSKIGKINIHLSQKVTGKIKTCTIKREASGWFVIFAVETEKVLLEKTGQTIGIDVGIENFLTFSNGEKVENLKYFETSQSKLRVAQRSVSRKKKGSNSRRKSVLKLKKIHQKIKNQRNDFAHKISTRLVKEFDVMAIEKLNIRGMSKGILAKQVHDVAWNNFFQKLKYKAENAGKLVVEVDPYGTSQICICGETVKKDLSVRQHKCRRCGHTDHRDTVSAKVILNRAGHSLKDITYAVGQCVSLESSSKTVSV